MDAMEWRNAVDKNRAGFVGALLGLILASGAAWAQSAAPPSKPSPASPPTDIGLIFTSSTILLELDDYEGGLGVKVGTGATAWRGSFDLLASSASSSASLTAGVAYEHHLSRGLMSPYLGAYARAGFSAQSGVLWTLPLSVGPLLGVEVSPIDAVSFFAEYCLALDLTITADANTGQTTFSYLIDTRVGNQAKLGIVVYLKRAPVPR
jgi:hypothetical protein